MPKESFGNLYESFKILLQARKSHFPPQSALLNQKFSGPIGKTTLRRPQIQAKPNSSCELCNKIHLTSS